MGPDPSDGSFTMMRMSGILLAVFVLVASSSAQVTPYGGSSPPGNPAALDSGGQVPYVGNAAFKLAIQGHSNQFGGAMILALAPAFTQVGVSFLLVDLNGAIIVPLPAGVTQYPVGVPNVPAFIGYTGYAQAAVFDPAIFLGYGLTNGVSVTILPSQGPTRAYLPGQDFSSGANAPGQMSVLDVSQQPPVFRATGNLGFTGNIGSNYSMKIAVAEGTHVAYALGNGTGTGSAGNQFVRAFDVTADQQGVVTYPLIGDIPVAGDIPGSCGLRDMEASPNGQYLFTITGSGTSYLEVFDTSSMPTTLPGPAVQTLSFPNAGGGPTGLELSPDGSRLVLLLASDSFTAVTIYSVGALPTPLSVIASIPLTAFPGSYAPADAHFTPDGRLLFVSGPNGFFSVIDTQPSPPQVLIPSGTWPATAGSLWFHGNAVATAAGQPVGIVGNEGTAASYYLIDLNLTSPSFGSVLGSFAPLTPAANGNISNHRMHGRQNIVVAIDGTGATVDCQMVDVIDLNQPVAPGFQTWRVKMPSFTTLTPGGLSSIPRDFDLF
jgi:hypothetical protein